MMHFPPVSDSPLFSKKFRTLRKIFEILPFFLVDAQISNFPLFSLFQYISPLFRENYYPPPYFDKCPPCFTQIHLLFTYFTCISFPHTFTMMHLCITQCTYWTPLIARDSGRPLIQSFIHSYHFYSASSSPLLLRSAPDYSTDNVPEFHAEAPQATVS